MEERTKERMEMQNGPWVVPGDPNTPIDKGSDLDAVGLRRRPVGKDPLALSVESVNDVEKEKLLDFKDLKDGLAADEAKRAGEITMETFNSASEDSEEDKDVERRKHHLDGYSPAPKMNTLVGFLRLANYVCACTVVMGVLMSLLYPETAEEKAAAEREAVRRSKLGLETRESGYQVRLVNLRSQSVEV